MTNDYLARIKHFEGFSAEAKWDYAQNTNGYGTRAKYAGEVISVEEAERRFSSEIAEATKRVDRFSPGLDEGTRAALTSLTFNAGTGWMSGRLGAAIRRGDSQAARDVFLEYTKAGGKVLDGLVARRMEEAEWMDEAASSASSKEPPMIAHASPNDRLSASLPGQAGTIQPREVTALSEQIRSEHWRMLALGLKSPLAAKHSADSEA